MNRAVTKEVIDILERLFPKANWDAIDCGEALQEAVFSLSVKELLYFGLGVENHFGVSFIPEAALNTALMAMCAEVTTAQTAKCAEECTSEAAD